MLHDKPLAPLTADRAKEILVELRRESEIHRRGAHVRESLWPHIRVTCCSSMTHGELDEAFRLAIKQLTHVDS